MNASAVTPRRTIQAIRPETVVREPIGRVGMMLGGKYRLEERIAAGGCASIWLATHVTLNRPVAVKFIETDAGAKSEVRVARFLREAKVAASVRHKNVVDILDFGASDDDDDVSEPYMIMELLEGESLDLLLQRTTLSTADAVAIIRQVLSGLDAVHAAGIVHRDMKPGNVFVTEDGDGLFARLLDFGISQELGDFDDHMVVGTPEYMSPEQAYGETLDGRSDLYSVGVMLYEMLAGFVPFEDADPLRVLQLVVNEKPLPLATVRPDLPALSSVVEIAMARHRDERFETARAMQHALVEAMTLDTDTRSSSDPGVSSSGEPRGSGRFRRETPPAHDPSPLREAPISPEVAPDPEADGVSIKLPLARRPLAVLAIGMVALLATVALIFDHSLRSRTAPTQVVAELPPISRVSTAPTEQAQPPSPPPEPAIVAPPAPVASPEPAPEEIAPATSATPPETEPEVVASPEPEVVAPPEPAPSHPIARRRRVRRGTALHHTVRTGRTGQITRELDF